MQVLVAEDEPIMLMALEAGLKSQGYDVVTAKDGREAYEILEKQTPDLVITDILMPITSGLDLLSMMKNNPSMKHVPVVVLSAMGQEDTVLQAFDLGAADFIAKPFSPQELIMRVKKVLVKEGKV